MNRDSRGGGKMDRCRHRCEDLGGDRSGAQSVSTRVGLCALVLGLALSGCGSYNSSDSSAPTAGASASMKSYSTNALYDAAPMEMSREEAADYDAGTGEAPRPQDQSRKLITTMSIQAETQEMDALLSHVEARVSDLGGYIESSDIYNGGSYTYDDRVRERRSANLTIRVPAERLEDFVSEVQERSNITSQSRSVEDVTLTYTDLESHKKMLQAEEERLLEFMDQAETIEDMIAVEARLTEVRYRLDSMESQLRTYDNRIDYSTVHLGIEEVVEYTITEEPKDLWEEISTGFQENLEDVKDWLRDLFIWVATHLPQLAVWAVAILIIWSIVSAIRRRRRVRLAAALQNGGLTPREQRRLQKEREKEEKRRAREQERMRKRGQVPPQGNGPMPPQGGAPVPPPPVDDGSGRS